MGRATRRGPWLPDEDNTLLHLVHLQGPNNWVRISQHMQHRTPKQCRERYHQNLKGSLNHEPISTEEGELIEQLVHEMGKRWAEIARRLGNRSDNAVKNWWNGSMNRRKRNNIQHSLSSRGVGPRAGPISSIPHPMSMYSGRCSPPGPISFGPDVMRPAFPHSLPTPERDHPFDLPRLTLPEANHLPTLSQPHHIPLALEPSANPLPAPRQLHTPQSSLDYKLTPLDWRSKMGAENSSANAAVSPAATECSNQRAPSLVSDRYSVSPKTVASPRPGLPPPIKTSQSYYDHRRRISHVSVASDGKVHTPLDEGYMSALPTTTSFDTALRRFPFDAPMKSLLSPMTERRPEYQLPLPKLSPLAERDNRMNVARLLD